ncbi:DUF6544 family protein [Devosia sp.]|uniref:DUF6544 family protein n=1 Tax=Devosia sp. TaxID=1871048 RepID=UPI002EFB3B05
MLRATVIIAFGLLAALAGGTALSWLAFSRAIDRETAALVAAARPVGRTVTEAAVARLPPPVQRFMRKAGVIGRPIPSIVRLRQVGRMRTAPTAAWMNFEADQVYTVDPPGFVWRAYFVSRSLPFVFGRDTYSGGGASILMKALGVVPVADVGGSELGAAGLMRYLNEMMWFPAAYLAPNVSWRAIDERSAEVSVTDSGLTARATLVLDGDDRIVDFRAQRFNTDTRSLETWETPISGHRELNGLLLPAGGQGVWKLDGGSFAYIELDVVALAYD